MRVATSHITAMLDTAARYAEAVQGVDPLEVVTSDDAALHGRRAHQVLERAANLAAHAAEELRDEALRAREGWPVV